MDSFQKKLKGFAVKLFHIKAIKFGEFKTKVGLMTPIYCDLRIIVSYPDLLNTLSELLIEQMKALNSFDIICGVPYTALPIATIVSIKSNIPMVMRRKEAKDYGTKKLIEGSYTDGNKCLIIEDVVTSGSSILETVRDLQDAGIKCSDAIVLLNREQGGEFILKGHNIKMHALLTVTQLMQYLREENCIDDNTVKKITNYLKETQVQTDPLGKIVKNDVRLKLRYGKRAELSKNPIAQELFKIMENKQTNLCLSADVRNCSDLQDLILETAPHICMLKLHVDILEDFTMDKIKPIRELAHKHKFLLFEDRKFADIGKIVQSQYSQGLYRISSWADVTTVHSITGKGLMDAIKSSPGLQKRGVFVLAETSAAGSLIDDKYTKETLKWASEYPDLVCGFVCQSPLFLDNPGIVQLTPGVQLDKSGDALGQQYNSPEKVVLENGADVAVVGRGITEAKNRGAAAEMYKKLLFDAYLKRSSSM